MALIKKNELKRMAPPQLLEKKRELQKEMMKIAVKDACASFISRCMALNLVDGTLAWYQNILRELTGFLAGKGIEELAAVEPTHMRDFLSHLRQKGHSSQTVSRTFGAVRCAFGFWHREGVLPKNPMLLVEKPRKEKHLIRPLSAEQAAKLIEQPDAGTFAGLRDRALMMLLMDSGLRVTEALSVEISRIDWMSCTLTVMGKGRKERSVPFSASTCQALLEYSRLRAQKFAGALHFFVGRTGNWMERCRVRRTISRYGKRAGIEGVRVSPHTLRHTFAVFYIRNGGDSFSLQEILGHSTLEMTRHYVHLARRDIAEQHKKFSPMEGLLGRRTARKQPSRAPDLLAGQLPRAAAAMACLADSKSRKPSRESDKGGYSASSTPGSAVRGVPSWLEGVNARTFVSGVFSAIIRTSSSGVRLSQISPGHVL